MTRLVAVIRWKSRQITGAQTWREMTLAAELARQGYRIIRADHVWYVYHW